MRPFCTGLVFALALGVACAAAQPAHVLGAVRDAEGEPLPGANVYLSGTTRGAVSRADGSFHIADLPPGAYRVVASMIGYDVEGVAVSLAPGDTVELAIRLAEVVREVGTVEVRAERDRRWERRFQRFREQLLGESENAAHCEILNPYVLDFRGRWGALVATASEPLVIENRALGYRLVYDLQTFEGSHTSLSYHGDERFEELAPADSAEARRWDRARRIAYRGSMRHLLRSLLTGTTEAEGFTLTLSQRDPLGYRATFGMADRPVSDRRVLRTDSTGWGRFRVSGRLGVRYTREAESEAYLTSEWFRDARSSPALSQHSWVHIGGRERVDPQGTPEDPFALTVSGYMAFERLADLLPAEYAASGFSPKSP